MSNLGEIKELLDETAELAKAIKQQYIEARSAEAIVLVSRAKVKSSLEHLRSCLEYAAADLVETLPTRPKRYYFPYGRTEQLYLESLERNLPGLDAKYRTLIDQLQPHACGDAWLIQLADASNFNKHVTLEKQVRENEGDRLHIGNYVVIADGAKVGALTINDELVNPGGPLSGKSSTSEVKISNPGVKVHKTFTTVRFVLASSKVDVLDLVERSHARISAFAAALSTA